MRNQQYHEVDKLELKSARIAARVSNQLRAQIIAAILKHENIDIEKALINGLAPITVASAIISHLRGAKRSMLQASKRPRNGNVTSLVLSKDSERGKRLKRNIKRVVKRPLKNLAKSAIKKSIDVTVEEAGLQDVVNKLKEVSKVYKSGKKTLEQIKKTKQQDIGEKSRIKSVPNPKVKKRKKTKRDVFEEQKARINEEIKEKLKKEKKYIYDEMVRHLRQIIRETAKESAKAINWREVLARLTNRERSIEDIGSVITEEAAKSAVKNIARKLVNKAKRKVRDKKNRLVREAREKLEKEQRKLIRQGVKKPLKEKILTPIEERVFGTPRIPGSHRQYRGMYYYVAKNLQELEQGQQRRRRFETAQTIYKALGNTADLVAFLQKYKISDIFTLLAELGGAVFFPETARIGGVVRAVNWLGDVAKVLELKETDEKASKVKDYHIEKALRLTQEITTIKKLFGRYYPQVYNILSGAGNKTNLKLREVVNDLILTGAHVREAQQVLNEAFIKTGLTPKNNFQLETIYRTQVQLAFSAGRYQTDQHPAIQEILWGYRYVTVGDTRVRPSHAILDGVTLPKEHPFWQFFWPPNGWNCRCQVISIFEKRKLVYPKAPINLENFDKQFMFNPGLVFTNSAAQFV